MANIRAGQMTFNTTNEGSLFIDVWDNDNLTINNTSSTSNIFYTFVDAGPSITYDDGDFGGGGPSIAITGSGSYLVDATNVGTGETNIDNTGVAQVVSNITGDGSQTIDVVPYDGTDFRIHPPHLTVTHSGTGGMIITLHQPVSYDFINTASASTIFEADADGTTTIDMADGTVTGTGTVSISGYGADRVTANTGGSGDITVVNNSDMFIDVSTVDGSVSIEVDYGSAYTVHATWVLKIPCTVFGHNIGKGS
jgi:hypothetical protein